MSEVAGFGTWLKHRRRSQDLTQKQLADSVQCAEITIRKIEANQLRPSKQLARRLLDALQVPYMEQDELIELSRRQVAGSVASASPDAEIAQ